MATLPSANVTISSEAGALAGGTGYCTVIAPVATNADSKPRVFSSARALLTQHGYSPGVGYAALHIQDTGKPVLFVGIPIATAGTVGRQNASGVTGTSVITVAAGVSGALEEVDAILTVTTGGTIGTAGIVFDLSLDGGVTEKSIRLGTATSYTIPYVGITISFAAGTLVAGDIYRFTSTAPMWDSTGMAGARTALAAQMKTSRSWLIAGDVSNATEAGHVTTAVNAYETSNDRFVYARVNVRDRLPLAELSRQTVRMTGAPNITFAEVGATGDTITRSAGSFISDGFVAGMAIDVSGSVSNNFTKGKITAVSATVLTLDTQDLVAEGPVANVTIVGSPGITFAEVGATGDTITRAGGGSFLDDGFRAGDTITITGSASNNVTGAITAATATVLTFNTTDLAAEFIGAKDITITKGETMSSWVSTMDSAFTTVDGQKRISIGLGRLRKTCPITLWNFRRPVSWAASIREYQHDVHVTTWRKDFGPLLDWSALDADGNIAEFDEYVTGGGLAGRFTVARSWSNGPNGAFIAADLTRDSEGSLLSLTHNMAVANVFCAVVQSMTERFVGRTPRKTSEGFLFPADRAALEEEVNSELQNALMREFVPGEGPRASSVKWTASPDDDLSVPDATITGDGQLEVNGTIFHVNTVVKVS